MSSNSKFQKTQEILDAVRREPQNRTVIAEAEKDVKPAVLFVGVSGAPLGPDNGHCLDQPSKNEQVQFDEGPNLVPSIVKTRSSTERCKRLAPARSV